jgi:hypothetical protein
MSLPADLGWWFWEQLEEKGWSKRYEERLKIGG